MTEHDRRIATLPKWAQGMIRDLERELERALSAAELVLSDEDKGSPYSIEEIGGRGLPRARYLPKAIMGVTFRLNGRQTIQARVAARGAQPGHEEPTDTRVIRVAATDGRLHVFPEASNSVYIGVGQ